MDISGVETLAINVLCTVRGGYCSRDCLFWNIRDLDRYLASPSEKQSDVG